jgi:hypothetical protein
MKKVKPLLLLLLITMFSTKCFSQVDSTALNNIFGRKGTIQSQVYKITFPRSDLGVKVNDFPVAAGFALTSWMGFITMGNESMVMGDLVLLDAEVSTVVNRLVAAHFAITAIHNHLINEKPNIKYIHFSGSGNALQLADSIKSVLSVTGTPLTVVPGQNKNNNPDWSKVEMILGKTGKHNGDLLQYSFPRKEKLTESGMEMPPAIGMATAINFQMNNNVAAITGDFVLLPNEVNLVVKALTENGITVTAIHNHMLFDEPRLFMLHFWGVDNPEKLATGLKAA